MNIERIPPLKQTPYIVQSLQVQEFQEIKLRRSLARKLEMKLM